MVYEIIMNDKKKPYIDSYVAVAVTEYGACGCKRVYEKACSMPPETSCVGRSGDSLCGCFGGYIGINVIRCFESKHDAS
jgi:hypothetical protein